MNRIAGRLVRASPALYGAMIVCAATVRADNCSGPSDCQAVPGNVDWTTGFAISGVFILICWRLLGPRLTKRPGPPPAPPAPPAPPDPTYAVPPLAAGAYLAARQPEHRDEAEWDGQAYDAAPPTYPEYQPYPSPSAPGYPPHPPTSAPNYQPYAPPSAPPDRPLDEPPIIRQIPDLPGDLPHESITVRDLSTGSEGGTGARQFPVPGDQPPSQAGRQGASGADLFDRQARPVDAPGTPGDRGHAAFTPGDQPPGLAGHQGAAEANLFDRQGAPVDAPGAPGDRGHDAFGARQGAAEHDLARAARPPEAVQQPSPPHASPPEASTTPDATGRPGNIQHTPPGAPSEAQQQGQVPGAPGPRDLEHSVQALPDAGLEHGRSPATGPAEHRRGAPPGVAGMSGAEHSQAPGGIGPRDLEHSTQAIPDAGWEHGSPLAGGVEHAHDAPPGVAGVEHGQASGAVGRPVDQYGNPPAPGADREHGILPAASPFEHTPQDAPGTGSPLDAQHGGSEAAGPLEREHTRRPGAAGDTPPRHPPPASGPPGIPVDGGERTDQRPHERKPG